MRSSPLLLALCVVTVIRPVVSQTGAGIKMYANDVETTLAGYSERTPVDVACWYEHLLYNRHDIVYLEEPLEDLKLQRATEAQTPPEGYFINYTIVSDRAYGVHGFICRNSYLQAQLTVTFGRATVPTDPPPATAPSSPSSPSPFTPSPFTPSTPSPSTTKTSELKPLIYTIGSVVLLGTLAVVAIITCWIRARRSFNQRVARSNNAPQDYLDYISDNEFTPLTASEFSASLQERPPTYNESQRIEDDMRQDGSDEEGQPPTSSSSGEPEGTTTTSPPPVVSEEAESPPAPERCPSTGQETDTESSREREIHDRFQQNIAEIFGIEFLD